MAKYLLLKHYRGAPAPVNDADAARNAPNLAERDHQTRQAARLNQHLQHHR
jgi:hypothetical protein